MKACVGDHDPCEVVDISSDGLAVILSAAVNPGKSCRSPSPTKATPSPASVAFKP